MSGLNWSSIKEVRVGIRFADDELHVGRLAERERRIYFEYDGAFLEGGLQLSPFRLPLEPGVKTFDPHLFEGLPGVFNDSLPDGWGRLLTDRMLRQQNVDPAQVSILARLTQVERHGIGALTYRPDHSLKPDATQLDLDQLAYDAETVLAGEAEPVLKELVALNGSSAGARPKVLVGADADCLNLTHSAAQLPDDYRPWLVKFANSQDGADAGAIEYVYALMAKEAGITMTDVHLFPARSGAGYFATRRFDRDDAGHRLHCHTACGLLHSDFRTPSLDYEDLLALTAQLARDMREVVKAYRLAVFNVLAHNRDDHSKNFSFLMNATGEWKLAPAYDLTFSSGISGEQSTTVLGEGRNPGVTELKRLGIEAKLPTATIATIIEQTRSALARWPVLAAEHGVSRANCKLIADKLGTQQP